MERADASAIIMLDLGSSGTLDPEGDFVNVPVTYECDISALRLREDLRISIFVEVEQRNPADGTVARGTGKVNATCPSSPKKVVVTVQVPSTGVPPVPYHQGVADARTWAVTSIGGTATGPKEQIPIT